MTQEAYGVERGHPCSMPKACYEWTALSKALLQPGQRNPGSDHTPWLEAHWQKDQDSMDVSAELCLQGGEEGK